MSRTVFALLLLASSGAAADPIAVDDRLQIELFADSTRIVTPTGLDVDARGRVWAIESHTHFPPEGYDRHDSDRILVFIDEDNDGKPEERKVFADGFTHSMSIALRLDGAIFLATRAAIYRLFDDDNDLKMDRKERLVHLETSGTYPHNGLAGISFDALGQMHFGFGENLGADYTIIGSDGTRIEGGGEGGNFYRCQSDGSNLQQIATGFWNPHASCIDAFGRIFTVDNDPDSRPPCRLLHVIEGGDYGFRFSNGRKGLHPYTSWNGEVPGTLPMVAGTGEAPSGILAYESSYLPQDYIGCLVSTSWGDHRIERFRLKPRGSSFESVAETIIQGEQDFRPVGIACGPDGALYVTDWVKRDYKLHGHGRIWRIMVKEKPPTREVAATEKTETSTTRKELARLKSADLKTRRRAARHIARDAVGVSTLEQFAADQRNSSRSRYEAFAAIAKRTAGGRNSETRGFLSAVTTSPSELSSGILNLANQKLWSSKQMTVAPAGPIDDRNGIQNEYARHYWTAIGEQDRPDQALDLSDPFNVIAVKRRLIGDGQRYDADRLIRKLFELDDDPGILIEEFRPSESLRLPLLLALHDLDPEKTMVCKAGLESEDLAVLHFAMVWVGEQHVVSLKPLVEAALPRMTTPLLLRTWIATMDRLNGADPKTIDRRKADGELLKLLKDDRVDTKVRPLIVRQIPEATWKDHPELLSELLSSPVAAIRTEALRVTAVNASLVREALLKIARDEKAALDERLDAVASLCGSIVESDDDAVQALLQIAESSSHPEMRQQVARGLRLMSRTDNKLRARVIAAANISADEERRLLGEQTPNASEARSVDQWLSEWPDDADPLAGRRVFFSRTAQCSRCHRVEHRGGNVGPDLSVVARKMSRKEIVESIVHPSKEIAPQFSPWTIVLKSGRVVTGMLIEEDKLEAIQIGTSDGKVETIRESDIETREPSNTSVMPKGLPEMMTSAEFFDLVSWLELQREQ